MGKELKMVYVVKSKILIYKKKGMEKVVCNWMLKVKEKKK
jgi:hypothetical protein